jgi:hypothetical protein
MSKQSIVVALVASLFCPIATAASQPIGALRPEVQDLRKTIQEGIDGSPTFRRLLERLNASNLVVYVRFGRCAGAVAGCTHLIAHQGTARRLLIVLDRFGRSPWDLVALLAHELQHALEIADAASVVDVPSLRHLYATTGRRVYATTGRRGEEGYETDAAIRVARTVTSELAKRRRR